MMRPSTDIGLHHHSGPGYLRPQRDPPLWVLNFACGEAQILLWLHSPSRGTGLLLSRLNVLPQRATLSGTGKYCPWTPTPTQGGEKVFLQLTQESYKPSQ